MFKRIHQLLAAAPTPMAGLALGLASLGCVGKTLAIFLVMLSYQAL
ncbi:Uncharacterised protein [Iodobacter fluviatilis]|uniref:Uncharacterized protein n=1 Tax=Iodobacter fluviatilis TaxID=537 RepID=A0A377SU77_9NEIS|nr:hypothetical protein [Iodobacter fluviatilis]STR44527.1 Uncharacterised protein [Iodobacter fluviatilis]